MKEMVQLLAFVFKKIVYNPQLSVKLVASSLHKITYRVLQQETCFKEVLDAE